MASSYPFYLNEEHIQFSSVAQSCPTLCDPMDCSTPGFPVHHQLLEPTQTHVHRVSDAIQPCHPLLSPSPPAFNLSQHQSLFPVSQFFASGGQSIGVSASASVLPMNIQDISSSVVSVVMYGCESWTMKKAENRRIDAFELWCWKRL